MGFGIGVEVGVGTEVHTEQIECTIRPGHTKSESRTPITTSVFPDSGVTIC